jgi:hypothetical protein
MDRLRAGLWLVAAGTFGWVSAAGAAVQVPRSISFSSGAGGSQAVREQCALETKIPAFIAEFAADVELVDGAVDPKGGRALELSIIEVHAPGGGAFSGPKWVAVQGRLFERGRLVGSFRAKRFSTGGAFAEFKGTCDILGRCARAIGMDVARWLDEPTMDAELGDAR